MNDDEIIDYLKVEWLTEALHGRLVESVGLRMN